MSSPAVEESRTLTHRAARGAAWAVAGNGLRQILGIVVSVLLMRALQPEDYGLVAMAMLWIYIISDLRDLRFADALIHHRAVSSRHLDSVFWLHAGLALVCGGVFAACAPLLARFNARPALAPIAMALATKPLLDSLGDVPRALLSRRLAFGLIAFADFAALLVAGAIAIALARFGYRAWSLVALNLVASVMATLLLTAGARWRPGFHLSGKAILEMGSFSGFLYGARASSQAARNVDKLLVGRVLGSDALGQYGQAYRLMMMPLEQIAIAVSRVMYSALSEIQDDLDRLRGAYLRAVRMLTLAMFPVTAGMAVVAGEFVRAALTAKWTGAIPAIRLLCVAGSVESVVISAQWIFFSCGRTRREFVWTLGVLLLTTLSVAVALPYGVTGVAAAYLVRTAVLALPTLLLALRLLRSGVGELLRALAPTAAATAFMVGGVLALRAALTAAGAGSWALLLCEVAAGAILYVAMLYAIGGESVSETWCLATRVLGLRCMGS